MFGKIEAQAYDTAAYKCAADDLLLSAAASTSCSTRSAPACVMDADDTIRRCSSRPSPAARAVRGRVFIDCSGDGDLAAWAGAPFEHRRRPRQHALSDHDVPRERRRSGRAPARPGRTIPALMDEAERRGVAISRARARSCGRRRTRSSGASTSRSCKTADGSAIDGTDADELSAGEIEGRRQVARVLRLPEARGAGLRQRLYRRHRRRSSASARRGASPAATSSAGDDVLACASFPDTIGVNGWPIETHVAGDVEWRWPPIPASRGFNHLPYRMLLPQKVQNLLVAGRCASMTHEGQSAARVSGACFVMGQAAGTAAAPLRSPATRALADIPVEALQALLEKDGAYLGRDSRVAAIEEDDRHEERRLH